MDFQFGAAVRQRDGDKFGSLRAVVFDPRTQQVVSLVVQHGLQERLVLVPIGALEHSEGDEVYLELSSRQFEQMPDFESVRNLAPPPDADNIEEDEVTDPLDVADVLPVGAATGVESIGFTPIIQETTYVPDRDVIVDKGTEVWATDGHIGHVGGIVVSQETDRLSAFIVPEGFIFTHNAIVPMDWVSVIENNRVVLTVDKQAAESSSGD